MVGVVVTLVNTVLKVLGSSDGSEYGIKGSG